MRILSLYMTREYLKMVTSLSVIFLGTYTLFDFIEKVDNFHEAGVSSSYMLSFFLLQLPELLTLLLPMAVLLGTILTLGLMANRNEITAIKASGVSLFRITLPIILIATIFTMVVALINETVLPKTKGQTNYIWDVLVEKRPGRLFHKEKFWLKGHSSIYHVGYYDRETQSLSDVVYYRFDQEFHLLLRVDARRARYLGGRWIFFSGLIQERLPDGGYSAVTFKEKAIDLPERPDDFTRLAKPSEEMNFAELNNYVTKVEEEGYDSRRYRVDLQAKISFPFVCLIMALIGIPLSLLRQKGESIALSVILGTMAALIYWISFSYIRSLFGYGGVLPPFFAAWLSNGIFILAALWMLTNIRQ
jgi:lipopolysaccharide export system permease protein